MRTRICAATLAAATVLPLAGCSQGYGTGASGYLCKPVASIKLSSGVITGSLTATCIVPPRDHQMAVFLKYQPVGVGTQPTGTMASNQNKQIPAPTATVSVSFTCLPGRWWVVYIIAGDSPDGTPFGKSNANDPTGLGTVSMDDCNRK